MSNTTNESVVYLTALLDRQRSKAQIANDMKELEKSLRKLRLVATLVKGETRNELNQMIRGMEAQLRQVRIQARMDRRQLNREIDQTLRNVSVREIQANFDEGRLNTQIRRAVSQARELVLRNPISVNIDVKRDKLLSQLDKFLNKHTKINESAYWLGEAERLQDVIGSVTNQDELRDAEDQLQVFTSGVQTTGYASASATDKIRNLLQGIAKIADFLGLTALAAEKFRQSLHTLKENDTILTEIYRTGEVTRRQLKELGDEAFSVAGKYGQASGSYLLAVQEMSRAGYKSLSKELGELSLLAQSAGNMSADLANNYLLATDAAYQYGGSVEKLNDALDGASYISRNHPASLTDIADAANVSASYAAKAGVGIDELTAAESAMLAVTKQSGLEIGRAFRSIILTLQQESGQFDEEVIDEEQLKKAEARCHALGVELTYVKDGAETLRNPMEVLKELSQIYNSLPDGSTEKQGLLSDLGGQSYGSSLSALLSNWDLYEKMLGEYSQGSGSALEEAYRTADSWAGRLTQLQNSWDSFVNSVTNQDMVKGGISFLDHTIQAFEKLSNAIGVIPVLLTTVNAGMAGLNKDYGITQIYNKDAHKIDIQGNFMGLNITEYKKQVKHFQDAEAAMEDWNQQLENQTADINTFSNATVQNNEHLKAYLNTTSVQAPASIEGYKSYLRSAGVATDALRLKTMLLTSAFTFGLSFGIQFVISGIMKIASTGKEAAQSAKELGDAFQNTKSELEGYETRIKELHDTISDSGSSMEEVANARKELMTIQDEMIEKYGSEKGAVLDITNAINGQVNAVNGQADAFDRLLGKQWQATENQFNKSDIWGDIGNRFSGYKNNIDRMLSEYGDHTAVLDFTRTDMKLPDLQKYKELLSTIDGVEILDTYDGKHLARLNGNATDVYDTILEIQQLSEGFDIGDSLDKQLVNAANNAKEISDNYKNIFNEHIFNEKILKDDKYTKIYKGLTNVYEQYQDAVLSGDEREQKEKTDAYAKYLTESLENVKDEDVSDFLQNMFPEMQEKVAKWKFQLNFEPDVEDSDFRNQIQSALDKLNGKSSEGILGLNLQAASEREKEGYYELRGIAREYDMDLQWLVALLEQNGMVQPENYQQLVKTFGQENVESLKPEDLEIAYKIENAGEMTFEEFYAEIQRMKESMNTASTFDISTYKEELDNIQSSISTLRSALDLLNSGDLSKIEVIDLMQQFPDLAPYVDLTADAFGNLSEGLSLLMNQQPGALIQSLQELKGNLTTDEERTQVELLIDSLQRLGSYGDTGVEAYATTIGNTWSDTENVIGGVVNQFENLAKVQEMVADGLTMSATAAAELAKMYPEILTNAEMSANGQITLNEGVVNSILEGDSSIIDAQIAKLEADKAELTAKKSYAEAQLDMVKQVAEGEGNISSEVAQYRLDVANKLLHALVEAGMEEDRAYAAVAANMAGNMDEYDRIVGEVAEDIAANMDAAAVSMAESISINSINSQVSFGAMQDAVRELAETIKASGNGEQGGNDIVIKGGGSTSTNRMKAKTRSGSFNTTTIDYEGKTISLDEFDSQLEIDIQAYTDAISNIDAQIEVLRNLQATFDANGGIGGHGYADKIKQLEKEKEAINDARKDAKDSGAKGKEEKETKETFNWIETAISRVQRLFTKLKNTVSSTYKSWSTRNNALGNELHTITEEFSHQQRAYEKYMGLANSVGLDGYYQHLVQIGDINLSEITDDVLKEQIKQYKEYYEKALDAKDAVEELKDSMAELAKVRFDNLTKQFEAQVNAAEQRAKTMDEQANQIKEMGYLLSRAYYEQAADNTRRSISELQNEYSTLNYALKKAVDDKDIAEFSEEWYEMQSKIKGVEHAIMEANTSLIEYGNTLRELEWERFDLIQDHISGITEETSFLMELLSKEELLRDKGVFSIFGEAVLGLRSLGYETYLRQAQDYAKEIEKIEASIANDKNNTKLLERREELLKLQRENILSAQEEKQAIRDLYEESFKAMLSHLQELIDKRKEALKAEKDLYDYQKNIEKQTKAVTTYQKQLDAYAGDTSEETKATIQKLKVSLEEAKQELKDTEYDKWLDDQERLMDELYNEYESLLNRRLDNIDGLMKEAISQTNANSMNIRSTILAASNEAGYTITNAMGAIWGMDGGVGKVLSDYSTTFVATMSNLQLSVDAIKNYIAQIDQNPLPENKLEGDAVNGWRNENGGWSYYENSQKLSNTWIKDKGKYYHLNENGAMDANQWIWNDSGTWSYVDGGGAAMTGWQYLHWNGRDAWFNFDENGIMKANEWINDYFVDAYGYMRSNEWIGHNGKYYWVGADGKWLDLPGWSLEERPQDGNPIYEYARGSRYIPSKRKAWTQEKGKREVIYRASDGAMLTPLGKGDKVFTPEMSEKLWYMLKGNPYIPERNMEIKMPDYGPIQNMQNVNQPINNEIHMDISLPNVTNSEEFVSSVEQVMRDSICKNGLTKKCLVEAITAPMLGKGTLASYKYRY